MKYCINCANVLPDSAKYCPNCGKPVYSAAEAAMADNKNPVGYEPEDLDVGYRVILISRENCSLKKTKEVLMDLLGYTNTTITDLLSEIPVEIADELTEEQAVVLAQALTEYGMQVTIVDEKNRYVNLSNRARASVFRRDGSLTSSALLVLETLTAANRVHRYNRYRKTTSLADIAFALLYAITEPQHVRRTVVKEPETTRRITVQRPAYVPPAPPRQNPAAYVQRTTQQAPRTPQPTQHTPQPTQHNTVIGPNRSNSGSLKGNTGNTNGPIGRGGRGRG